MNQETKILFNRLSIAIGDIISSEVEKGVEPAELLSALIVMAGRSYGASYAANGIKPSKIIKWAEGLFKEALGHGIKVGKRDFKRPDKGTNVEIIHGESVH